MSSSYSASLKTLTVHVRIWSIFQILAAFPTTTLFLTMAAPIAVSKAPPEQTSYLQSFSQTVLSYLETISSGKRQLPPSQVAEIGRPQHDNKFLRYMSSSDSDASDPSSPVDLSLPISNYFINSSHNTYLTGNQLYSQSSTDAYKNVRPALSQRKQNIALKLPGSTFRYIRPDEGNMSGPPTGMQMHRDRRLGRRNQIFFLRG